MPTRLLLEGTDLAELVAHVRAEFGPHAKLLHAERVRTGGIAGFFARERFELTIEVPEVPAEQLRPRRPPVPAASMADLLAAADAGDDVGFGRAALPATGVGDPRPAADRFAEVLEQVRTMTGAQVPDYEVAVPAPEDRVFAPLAPEPVTGPPVQGAAIAERAAGAGMAGGLRRPADAAGLRELGVPDALLAGVPAAGPVRLSAVLAGLPEAPELPRRAGEVLVLVGPADAVVAVADQVADRLHRPVTSVVHAGESAPVADHGRRITTPAAARSWRGQAATADGVVVVALGAEVDRRGVAEAAELLGALAPEHVWAVVDARHKPRDTRRWLAALAAARPIEALTVQGTFETTQPGTVLDLGVPVAWIDGVPATRVAWAAALSQRLDDPVWD